MKTLFKNILVLAVMLGTCTSYANETLEVVPTFNNVKKGNSITVTDATGLIIFSGQINFDGNISRLYNFSQLEDGIYILEVNKDFEINISTVEVKGNVVTFLNNKQKTIFKPVFRVEDDLLIITKFGFDSPKMQVDLYYGDELIHTENVKGSEILNRIFKLDKTIKGDYSAVVRTNGRVYVENFRI